MSFVNGTGGERRRAGGQPRRVSANRGLITHIRRPIEPVVNGLGTVVLPEVSTGLNVFNSLVTGVRDRVLLKGECVFRNSFIDVRLKGDGMIAAQDCVISAMGDGAGWELRGCRLGSARRPDGQYRRADEDGIRPCRVPGSTATPLFSVIDYCDIINVDGRNGDKHMDGLQMWQDGNLEVTNTKIAGWWQSAVLLKTDHGAIDNVRFHGCSFSGANYFQLRIIDGGAGFGRPTNVTITECVVERGVRGGVHPVNSGDDRCTGASQTKFVRTEAERLDPTWIVYDQVVTPDGIELPPPGGWYTHPASKPASKRASKTASRSRLRDPLN